MVCLTLCVLCSVLCNAFLSLSLFQNRQALLTAAGEMGACGGQLLMLAEETEVDIKIQEALVSMAKAVASATAAFSEQCQKCG